nr:unnamed protein product [Digitaria exilis]
MVNCRRRDGRLTAEAARKTKSGSKQIQRQRMSPAQAVVHHTTHQLPRRPVPGQPALRRAGAAASPVELHGPLRRARRAGGTNWRARVGSMAAGLAEVVGGAATFSPARRRRLLPEHRSLRTIVSIHYSTEPCATALTCLGAAATVTPSSVPPVPPAAAFLPLSDFSTQLKEEDASSLLILEAESATVLVQ